MMRSMERRAGFAVALLSAALTSAPAVWAQAHSEQPPQPARPALPDEAAREVEELGAKIQAQHEAFLKGESDSLEEAIALAERVLAIRLRHEGPESDAGSRWTDAKGRPAEWYEVGDARRLADELRLLAGIPAERRAELASLIGLDQEAERLYGAGRSSEALAMFERPLEVRRRVLGDEHKDTLTSMNDVGLMLVAQAKLAEAEPYLREALAGRRRVLGDEHRNTLGSLNNMGFLLNAQGKLTEAEPYYREAMEGKRRLWGDQNPDTLLSINNVGALLLAQGGLAEAEPYLREALEGYRRILGDEDPGTLQTINNMGGLLHAQGRVAEAEPYWREALEGRRRVLGDGHPATLESIHNMGFLLNAQGKFAEAELYYREAMEGRRRHWGDKHPDTLNSINSMGALLFLQGKLAEAEPYVRESLESRRVLGSERPDTLDSINNMGVLLITQGKPAEGASYLGEALEGRRRVLGDEHPRTLLSIDEMGRLLLADGKLAEAEPYLCEALAGRRRVLGNEHSDTLRSITSMGSLLLAQGKLAEAEPYFREALGVAERSRSGVVGEESARAAYAGRLDLSAIAASLSALLIEGGRPSEALGAAERGRGRALLDLLARADRDVVAEAKAFGDAATAERIQMALGRESAARAELLEAEARLAAAIKERQTARDADWFSDEERPAKLAECDRLIEQHEGTIVKERQALGQATSAVLAELRMFLPAADVLDAETILSSLGPREALLCYIWTPDRAIVLAAGRGQVTGAVVAKNKDEVAHLAEQASAVREWISQRPADATARPDAQAMNGLLSALLPASVLPVIESASRLVVLPDGPLYGIPLETLVQTSSALSDKAICYASSATLYLDRVKATRQAAPGKASSEITALLLGDPVYDRETPPGPEYPAAGVLVAMVQEGSNAANGGLQRGDVILRYAGRDVASREVLMAAVGDVNREVESQTRPADERFPVTVCRDGQEVQGNLAPGRLGVVLDQRPPADGLRAMARAARGIDENNAEATALDQVRLFGGVLEPLPGTAREVRAIAGLIEQAHGEATVFVGEESTVGNLAASAPGRRYLHLATHGLAGNADRPYEASLALTRPEQPGPQDIGFLRLEDLISSWRGKLSGCDLVVLSACDTQRGVQRGDSLMALPWGFFYAGTPTVIASLWKVDDTATALLMVRLYENLLGERDSGEPMPKLEALREAQAWLRGLTLDEAEAARRRLELDASALPPSGSRGNVGQRRPGAAPAAPIHPYEHPYYWAAFVLLGSPE